MTRMTIEQARLLTEQWQAEFEDHQHESAIQSRFSDVPAHELLTMWERCTNERGKRLTKFEVEALACALYRAFGCVPGAVQGGQIEKREDEPLPPDDTMLPLAEVLRLTGISQSSIKRLVEAGLFPKPIKLMTRRNGWPAREVKKWIAEKDELRRTERRY